MRILVLAGAFGTEADVSLSSGTAVTTALRAAGHSAALLNVAEFTDHHKSGMDFFDHPDAVEQFYVPPEPPTAEQALQNTRRARATLVHPGFHELCLTADVVFLALHGGYGEDGHTQALLEVLGVPFTGPPSAGCAVAFDKQISKRIFDQAGIPTPGWSVIDSIGAETRTAPTSFPVVVKPVHGGSAVGVVVARDMAELSRAVEVGLQNEPEVLVESYVPGREFTVAVLDGRALPVIEIETSTGIFDYTAKYQVGGARELCPAPIRSDESDALQRLALRAHSALNLGRHSYSRIDFRQAPDGTLYCLEANALPGLTPNSLFPLAARTAGTAFGKLCDQIVHLGSRTFSRR
jgi:D-alanine-D-alanine ligase